MPSLDWCIGDTGSHRLAWTQDGIMVDSSARKFLQLHDETLSEHNELKYLWKGLPSNTIEFAKRDKPLKQVEKITTSKEAVRRSFRQAITGDGMVVLFRRRIDETNRFDGRIQWLKGSSRLAWSEIEDQTCTTWTVIFGDGTAHTDEAAVEELTSWGNQENRVEQWGLVEPFIIDELWPALRSAHGHPILEITTASAS